ncbi:protein artichoke [Anthonomus grandis grandis]|uniref:protein artichoke n=1 Tax=Anthonomus grandis grandis TaxID=2921223 RepID=UPI0021668D7A|nr:protein artichoke [Anthonomus grandis grandis]
MNYGIKKLYLLITLITYARSNYVPCQEISSELQFPCACTLGPVEEALDGNPALSVDCDGIVLPLETPVIPYGAPVVSFVQRHVGHQSLPSHIFTSSLPLRKVDFSYNSLHKLNERILQNIQGTLTELLLANNLLGDTLNPIFSTSEFRGLKNLSLLDLSGNGIRAIEEGIFEGCDNLKELYLDNNDLGIIPNSSLNGPGSLKLISLQNNNIESLKTGCFNSQPHLETLILTNNLISTIESGSFSNLKRIKTIKLAHNRLSKFNSDVFIGAESLTYLDLSENFMPEFPSVALKVFEGLRYLNLSSNLIGGLDNKNLAFLSSLYELDLSRNSLTNIVPGTFLGLRNLKKLDISVNSLRTVEDDAFEGLDSLEHLNLKDNNILLIPASALGRLPRLTSLQLDYNRIAALSSDILHSIADKVQKFVLSTNVVRELPGGTFQFFTRLDRVDLRRNWITSLSSDAFLGLENSLLQLDLGENRIMTLPQPPISLKVLESLDLSSNHLTDLPVGSMQFLPALKRLNLSDNVHLTKVPGELLRESSKLEIVDLSRCGLSTLPPDLFLTTTALKQIHLRSNNLTEILENTFVNMPNLTILDLSYNNIGTIKPHSFAFIMNIKQLNLKGNQLSSFKGEYFNTGTSLEILDISDNQLSYLFPSSFKIHPRLKRIIAKGNKFNFFPAELISNLQFLEVVDLSFNQLKNVDELDYARLPRLHTLLLSHNELEGVSEMAFHNSTQLQILDLSYNKLERLGERTFESLLRLKLLNLEGNLLADLPDNIFERIRLQMLENINLSRNRFTIPPLKSLQRQYFFLNTLDLSFNGIEEVPKEDQMMVNIKQLDLSYNPLTPKAVSNIFNEPKTVRSLNLAGTGIAFLPRLETPFLKRLNLTSNNISRISEDAFERTTLLESLDLSNNSIGGNMPWQHLKNLRVLNLSLNPIEAIEHDDFYGLSKLRYLSIHSLDKCTKIEKSAFKSVPNLSHLEAYGYPKVGYLDLDGVLQNVPLLETVNIETKDAAIGKDQLHSMLHPRLRELTVRGLRLKSISSGTLSGLKAPEILIRFVNTSLTSLPPALFFPMPRSSKTTLDLSDNQLTTLSVQFLTTLEDRRGDLKILGLETNPIICDCNSRALRRWLPSHMVMIRCSGPSYFEGKLLSEIGDDELTCDPKKITRFTTEPSSTSHVTRPKKKSTEPDIIWSMPPVTEKSQVITKTASIGGGNAGGNSHQPFNNDDTLIIGIVGGVVAFIAILIIVICIIRFKMSSNQYRGGAVTSGSIVAPGHMIGSGSSCACSVKGAPPLYAVPRSYTATLPHSKMTTQVPMRMPPTAAYSTMGRDPYNVQPYFIAAYPGDEKMYHQ